MVQPLKRLARWILQEELDFTDMQLSAARQQRDYWIRECNKRDYFINMYFPTKEKT